MRSGVVAAGVLMMIIGGALVVFIPTNGAIPFIEISGVGILIHQVVGAGLAFLGLLVFIAGLAASPPQKAPSPVAIVQQPTAPAAAPEALVICPECGARVSSKSKFCSECGADLKPKLKVKPHKIEEEKTEAPKPAEGKPKKTGFCMYCGTELPEGSDFCSKCGKEIKKVQRV